MLGTTAEPRDRTMKVHVEKRIFEDVNETEKREEVVVKSVGFSKRWKVKENKADKITL